MTGQAIKGNGNIQAGRDVTINAIVSGIKVIADIDKAIEETHSYCDNLEWRKGRIDGRIFLALGSGIAFVVAANLSGPVSWLLYMLFVVLIFLGRKVHIAIGRIDAEMAGARLLLTELYKMKITHQIDTHS